MDLVPHETNILPKRLDLERQTASLQSLPVIKQLALMNLRPRFHEPPLPARPFSKPSAQASTTSSGWANSG